MNSVAEFVCDFLPFGDANRLLNCSKEMRELFPVSHHVWSGVSPQSMLSRRTDPQTSFKAVRSPRSCRQCGILTSNTLYCTTRLESVTVCRKCFTEEGGYFQVVSRKEALSILRGKEGELQNLSIAKREAVSCRSKRKRYVTFYWIFQVLELVERGEEWSVHVTHKKANIGEASKEKKKAEAPIAQLDRARDF